MWGTFEHEENIHVIPVTEEGKVVAPHTVDDFCCCSPAVVEQDKDGKYIILHNQVN